MILSVDDPDIGRVMRSKEQARRNYDRLSRWYDRLAGAAEHRWTDLTLQMLEVESGQSILEIGYGPGRAVEKLAQSVGSEGKVYGLDISAGMQEVARGRLEKAGLTERVDLRIGDAIDLPFDDGSMDAVLISFTLELFDTPEIPLVLAECRRVLRPDGRLGVVAMQAKQHPGFALRTYTWAHERWPVLVDCRPIYLRQSIERARFEVVETTAGSMWGLPVEIVIAGRPR